MYFIVLTELKATFLEFFNNFPKNIILIIFSISSALLTIILVILISLSYFL